MPDSLQSGMLLVNSGQQILRTDLTDYNAKIRSIRTMETVVSFFQDLLWIRQQYRFFGNRRGRTPYLGVWAGVRPPTPPNMDLPTVIPNDPQFQSDLHHWRGV